MYNFVKSPVSMFDTTGAEVLEQSVRADHPFRIMNELVIVTAKHSVTFGRKNIAYLSKP